jgi:hypothetical protein
VLQEIIFDHACALRPPAGKERTADIVIELSLPPQSDGLEHADPQLA